MSSRRPDAGPSAAPGSEELTTADVDSIASHLLNLALPNSAEQHVETTLRRLASVCAAPEVPLRHVDRVQFFKARAPAPAPAPAPSPPEPASVSALRGDTGPSVAEYMAAKTAQGGYGGGHGGGHAGRTRRSNALRPPLGVTVAAPEPVSTGAGAGAGAGEGEGEGDGEDLATGDAVAVAVPAKGEESSSPLPPRPSRPSRPAQEPVPCVAPRRQQLPSGAFCRHAASTDNQVVNDRTSDRFLTPVSILQSSTSLQYAAPGWATSPGFVEGFDDECVLGDTAEERVGTVRPPTKDEFMAMWHDFTTIDYPAYEIAHTRWFASFKGAFPKLFELIGEANAAIDAAKQQAGLGSVPLPDAADEAAAVRAAVDAPAAMSLDESLARVQQTELRLKEKLEQAWKWNERLEALTRTAGDTKKKLCDHVLEHYEAIAEFGRAEPTVDVPPLRADCMAPIRVPPTMTHRVRYIGLRNHLHQFLGQLRDNTERYWANPKHKAHANDSPLAQWMPSHWHARLVDQRAVCFAAVKKDCLSKSASDGLVDYANAEREVAAMRALMQASMEQDADAFERIERLVDYMLRAFFEYAPSEPRNAGSKPANDLSCTWEDVERYACHHVLPFVTRLLLGDAALKSGLSCDYAVANAPGVVPFSAWMRSRGGAGQAESPSFRTTLEALKKEVDDNTVTEGARTTGDGPAWGDKSEQARFAAVLQRRLDSLPSSP